MVASGFIADWVQKIDVLTTVQVRKMWTTLSFVFQALALLLTAYIPNIIAIIVFMTFGGAFGVFSVSGYAVNYLDIAPYFAGVLMGISQTVASVPGMISPIVTGLIVTDHSVSYDLFSPFYLFIFIII
jgi:MFS transporter, ACS family, solute carrier family 17 (sodium-dependent inorganic phosphate cotransporter), other